jgi:hypothetical protein
MTDSGWVSNEDIQLFSDSAGVYVYVLVFTSRAIGAMQDDQRGGPN